MTTTVFFVRHGSHDRLGRVLCGRMDGVTLSAKGQAEAQALAERLKGEPITMVHVSPLERARQTAAPIAGILGLEPVEAPALNEIDYGEWTGATFEALEADERWSDWNRARGRGRAPGGESARQVQERVVGWIAAVRRERPGQAVAAVCHSDVIKSGLAYGLGLGLDRTDRFEISPGSISVLAAGDWGMKVHSINEVPR